MEIIDLFPGETIPCCSRAPNTAESYRPFLVRIAPKESIRAVVEQHVFTAEREGEEQE
jgi:hypothetical protein